MAVKSVPSSFAPVRSQAERFASRTVALLNEQLRSAAPTSETLLKNWKSRSDSERSTRFRLEPLNDAPWTVTRVMTQPSRFEPSTFDARQVGGGEVLSGEVEAVQGGVREVGRDAGMLLAPRVPVGRFQQFDVFGIRHEKLLVP